ncbi:hypothetical protein [Caldovatus aquaticus]|uniref:Uncharacterized protein n=1 Tax=Caldovatus aquaticus TaxID=2865671 RepID=A0ABS7EXK7_9PROT|nr:hypothetical protein [Caldovatus aquaticus]MBW8268089.1 hypothetical protein [Caldovatus aquaticus]
MAPAARDLLAGWRAWRAAEAAAEGAARAPGAAALLAAAEAAAEALAAGPGEGTHDAAERAALAAHYAEAPASAPHRPGDPDPLREELLRMARIDGKSSRESAREGEIVLWPWQRCLACGGHRWRRPARPGARWRCLGCGAAGGG